MRKYLLVLFIVLFFSSLVFAAVPTMDAVGGSNTSGGGSGSQGVQAGENIYLRANTSDVTSGHNLTNVSHDGSTLGNVYIYYWSQVPNGSYTGYLNYAQLSISNFTNSSNNYCTFDIMLPSHSSIPSGTTHISFYFGLVQINTPPPPFENDFGDLEASEIDINTAPTNYFTYMTYTADTSTEAPTLDKPLASSTIGTSFSFQYDQPETAYEGSVKITFTRTGGTTDPNSPHVLEVVSEASGTDISFTLHGANLGGANQVTLDSGGNSLVDDAEYTVKIEYQDLAQNSAASDQNSGVLYDDDEAIEASGGDYNAGASFDPGSTNNAYFWLYLKKSTSGTALPVDDIEFDTTGSMEASDIDSIKIWRSIDNSFSSSADTYLLTISSGFEPLVFNFSPDEQIGTEGYYYFLTIDVSSSASGSDAIGAEIDYASDIDAYSAAVLGTFPITGGEHPLPVTMSSFTAQFTNDNPTLYWTTQSETNNSGWNIYRGTSQNMGQAILVNAGGLILGQGTTSEPTDYIYTDHNGVVENTTYWYWLESVDNGGETEMFGPISLTIPLGGGNSGTPAAPDDYGLQQNYPNPFNPSTKISFALEEGSNVILTIYNTKGQKIQTLFKGNVPADIVKSVVWDGRDNSGKHVGSGIYLYELQTNKETFIRKMILTK